jgi:hypothetical protein
MLKTTEETSLNRPSKLGRRAFMWTFDGLHKDDKLERFFSNIPGFCRSEAVNFPFYSLTEAQMENLLGGLIGFLDRTFSSDLIPELDKDQRAIICARVCDPSLFPFEYRNILFRLLSEDQYGRVHSAEIAHFVRNWYDGGDVGLMTAIVSAVVVRARRRDEHWFTIASDELRRSKSVLRAYEAHGDSLSLAILIHVTRQQFAYFPETDDAASTSRIRDQFWKVLVEVSKFDARNTLPGLQHEFCVL